MKRNALLLTALSALAGLAGYTITHLVRRARGSYEVGYSKDADTCTLEADNATDAIRRMALALQQDMPYTL